MDSATKSLKHIMEGGDYVKLPNVVVFDEHDEFDGEKKPVRKFDRAALEKIAKKCNERAKKTGDLSPFGPGHTITDAPEHLQPVTYGYAANYRVGSYGPENKLGLLVDFYVKKQVTRPDGKKADGLDEVKSYPRRSVELWLKDGFIDHIALLRRTPQRDLGLLEYAKDTHETVTIPSTGNLFSRTGRSLTAAVRHYQQGGKLCYSMESEQMDDVPAMRDDEDENGGFDPEGEDHKMFRQHADHYMKSRYGDNLKKYEMSAASPSGGNTFVPGEDEDDEDGPSGDPTMPPRDEEEVKKMAKMFESGDDTVKAKMYARLLGRVAAMENERHNEKINDSLNDAKARVQRIVNDGYVVKTEPLVARFAKMPTHKERDEYEAEVRETSQKDPFAVPGRPPRGMVNVNDPNEPQRLSKNGESVRLHRPGDRDKVVDYAMKHGIQSYEEACEKYYAKSSKN